MTTKEFSQLGKRLLPCLPGSVVSGRNIVMLPMRGILRGLHFENSSDRRVFYFWYLVLPLFVPTDHIYFAYGDRLRSARGEAWYADAPDLFPDLSRVVRDDALPYLRRAEHLDAAIGLFTATSADNPSSTRHREVLAYSLIRAGDFDAATAVLAELLAGLNPAEYRSHSQIGARAKLLQGKLTSEPAAAVAQLDLWEVETKARLGLDRFE